MMFNFYPWGLSLNIVEPQSIRQTKVSFYSFVWKESLLNKGAGSGLDVVEMEDEEVVEAVQKGIRSSFYHQGESILSPQELRGHIIFTGTGSSSI